jgi:hypothetical protein
VQTITARAINSLFRSQLIQNAITFHGGTHSITYEWGSPNHEDNGSEAPDDRAQAAIANVSGFSSH